VNEKDIIVDAKENMRKWRLVFQKAVFPILNNEWRVESFRCVEETELDRKYDIDYLIKRDGDIVTVAVRGREFHYDDVSIRQLEFWKMKVNIQEKLKGKKNVFPEYLVYFVGDPDPLYPICKMIQIWNMQDVFGAAVMLEERNKLKWRKSDNAYMVVPKCEINAIAIENLRAVWEWKKEGFNKHEKQERRIVLNGLLCF